MKHQHPPYEASGNGSDDATPPSGVPTEAEYLAKLARDHTHVVVKLRNGEQVEGFVEYYDQRFIRLTRKGQPNLFIFKHDIRYLFEE